MQLSYWGMTASPFRAQERMRHFFASPTHDEAIARLGFLVDSGRTLGILSGCEGTGRTTVLEVFARGMRQHGHMVCAINLVGLESRGFLWTLAAGLGCNPRASDDAFTVGRRIEDRLREHEWTGRRTVLLLDDADQAAHDVLIQVLRLLKSQTRGISIILAIESARMSRLGSDLLQLSQLRIRLEPWNEDDIREYLATSLSQAGCELRWTFTFFVGVCCDYGGGAAAEPVASATFCRSERRGEDGVADHCRGGDGGRGRAGLRGGAAGRSGGVYRGGGRGCSVVDVRRAARAARLRRGAVPGG
jgi:type II secretory pathway predicted ATPase ExeA